MTAVRRVFLPWDEPALPVAARLLAERHADADVLALERVTVVLPGARAGRRLTEILIEEADTRELMLVPPRVTTIGALPEQIYRPELPLAEEPLRRRVWALALRELPADERGLVFPDPPEPDDFHRWDRLASIVHGLHRETAGEGLAFSDVAESFRGRPGYDDSGRWRVLAAAQRDYHRRLRDLGYADPDAARLEALERDAVSSDRGIYLLGVVEMPGITRRMVESAARDATVVALVHAPEHREDAFDGVGCVRPEAWIHEEIAVDDESLVLCGRPPSQADAVIRCLTGEAPELAPDQVTVGVPDEDVVPFLEQRLEAYGVPHRYAGGTPMPRTDPHRLLSALADYLEDGRYRELAALLRHPRLERVIGVSDALERADRYHRQHLPMRVSPAGSGAADRLPNARRARRFREAVVETLEDELGLHRLGGRRPLPEWMPEILGLLSRVYGEELLDLSRPEERRLLEALQLVRDAAARFHRLPDGVAHPCACASAIRLLLSELRPESVPPQPARSAVELLGWLELHLDDAPVLVLTGFNERRVPEVMDAHPFLPNSLRARLGLRDNDRRYARDAYLLTAILASRSETRILVGQRDADGDPLRPSRLLLAAGGRELARRAERLFAEQTPEPGQLSRLGLEASAGSSFRSPPERVIRIEEPPDVMRVTEFGLLLKDSYRWALLRHLGLEELHDRHRELDGAAFGSLAHRVLHDFARSPARESSDPDAVGDQLSSLLDRASAREFGDVSLPAVRLQVEQLRARLRAFAAWHAGRVADGWRIVATEISSPEEGVAFDVDGSPVGIVGRIDRIDRHRDTGVWSVLDYKTGEKPRSPDDAHRAGRSGDRRWVDVQLPLYRHLLSGIAAMAERGEVGLADELRELVDDEAHVELGYVNLSRAGVELAVADWSAADLAGADEAAREAVRLLRSGEIRHREGEGLSLRDDPLASLLGGERLPVTEVTSREGAASTSRAER